MATATLIEKIEQPVAEPPTTVGRTDLYLDWFERCLIAVFYCWLVFRLVTAYLHDGNVVSLLLLPSEGLVLVFMLVRRTSKVMSKSASAWLLALTATCAPFLVSPGGQYTLVPLAVGGVVLLMGTFIQLHAKITLGRSLGCVAANRGLQLRGPYRFVRHPMYAGYLVSHLAFLALNPTWWNLAVYALCYGLQIPRLLLEERLLSDDPDYRDYQARVRFRLIPGVF